MGAGSNPNSDAATTTVEAEPGWGPLLLRGCAKRCPRCGGGSLFEGWFRMVERCGTCGLKFEREPGFFVGAYLINFAVTVILLFIISMGFVAMKAIDHDASPMVPLIVALGVAVVVPPFFYPFSRTIWSAFDIGMTPLEEDEIRGAADALARGDVGRVDRDDPSRGGRRKGRGRSRGGSSEGS